MSLDHQMTPMLRTLRLSGVLETLDVRNKQAVEQQLSHVEFLGLLLQDEVERRAQNKLRLRLRRASFDPSKTLEGFDFRFNPKLNKAAVFDLATCQFIEKKENVLIYGPCSTSPAAGPMRPDRNVYRNTSVRICSCSTTSA
jgi:DNA replication protein DnaC